MRLYLINPTNPLVSCVTAKENRWNRWRVWKPLSLLMLARITPAGIGARIADTARDYGVDSLNALFLTPLPGTRLWGQMHSEDRITLKDFPADWRYYTLTFPVARYQKLTRQAVIDEMIECNARFYALPRVLRRVWSCFWHRRKPLINLITNLSSRNNSRVEKVAYRAFQTEFDSTAENPRAPADS